MTYILQLTLKLLKQVTDNENDNIFKYSVLTLTEYPGLHM